MAAGLVKLRSDGRVHVRSAGSSPAREINPAVVEAMAEVGVDMSEEFPKPLTDEVVQAADVVITMGCGDACPIYPGKRYEDWVLDDPADQDSRRFAGSATTSTRASGSSSLIFLPRPGLARRALDRGRGDVRARVRRLRRDRRQRRA